jgi:CHAT domain-containing protein/Flp pilus assembly protein TadD
MAQQKYEEAITESKALIEEFPNYHNGYQALAQAAGEANQLEQVRVWLEGQLARLPTRPMALVGLAHISNASKDFAAAIGHYHNYLQQSPDDDRAAAMLANDYNNQKNGAAGEAYFKSLLLVRSDSVTGHQGLGVLYTLLDRRADALAEFDRVIALRGDNVISHSYRAFVLSREGRSPEGISKLLVSLTLLQANPDDLLERQVLTQLGDLYRRSGNYVEADRTLRRLLELARAADDQRGEETALGQLGSLYERQSNYLEALKYWRQALDVSRAITARKSKIRTSPQRHLGGIGDVYYGLGDLDAAEQAYLEALKLSAEAKDERNQSSMLKSLGDVYTEQGKFSEALSTYQHALAQGEKQADLTNQLGALNSLSALHRRLGNQQQALANVRRALKILEGRTEPLWQGESWNNLGNVHLRFREIPEAVAAFQKTLAIDQTTMPPRIVWEANSGLAAAYTQLRQRDKAREHYELAVDKMESTRANLGGEVEKAGFFQDKIAVYKNLIALLLNAPASEARSGEAVAFNYVERARARAFLDLLAEARVDVTENTTPDLLKRQQELQQRISQLTAQLIRERSPEVAKQNKPKIEEIERSLGKADTELAEWLRELRRHNPRYAALKYPEPITLSETQRMLDDTTVLLSYSLAEPESFLFAVSRNDFQVKRLPAEKTIDANVQKLLAAITDKNNPAPAEYRRQAASLSQQLLQPVSRMLAGKSKLIVVADGALHRLPFEVLFQPGVPQRGDLRQWPFLVRQFAISYSPSASVLAELQKEPRETAPKGFIAFGDPTYEPAQGAIAATLRATSASGRLNFQPLPYSHTEIEGIAKLFAKDDRELFFREAATEANVKVPQRLSSYRMIHFSTHGYVNEARPRFSGLVLSLSPNSSAEKTNPPTEDGLLAAYEIFNLKLNADLVVLSACETGLGKEVKGEGLMSLTRAFMYAGSPSVVVSLWNVNDESAADLMIRFYRHLQAGKTKSEALRQAQLETIRDNGFPFFWAPFVLIGKP